MAEETNNAPTIEELREIATGASGVGAPSVATVAATSPIAQSLEAASLAALKVFNDRFARIVDVFDDYRSKAQAGKLTADDEKLASAAIEHARALVETHKPLPPLPDALR
jgi:hypothetical protein